jgi:hypothetical protein
MLIWDTKSGSSTAPPSVHVITDAPIRAFGASQRMSGTTCTDDQDTETRSKAFIGS